MRQNIKAVATAARRRRARERATLRQRAAEATSADAFRPKSAHWRYLRAQIELLEDGQVPSQVAIARKMGLGRIAIWKMHRRHAGLARWVNAQLSACSQEGHGALLQKTLLMGLRGSAEHAKVYFTVTGALKSGALEGPANGVTVNGPTVVYLTVPRPGDLPAHASATLRPDAFEKR